MTLDPRIEAVRAQYGLDKDDFWQLPQNKGTWLVKHAALELVAAQAGVRFDMPVVLEAEGAAGIAALCVRGELGDRWEWATGEASPKNSKNAYPWAMAEKRAKDRVILKLVGIHGLVYSEDEMAGVAGAEPVGKHASQQPPDEHDPMSSATAKVHWKGIADALIACTTLKQLKGAWERHYPVFETLPEDFQKELTTFKDELKDTLLARAEGAPAVPPNFDQMERQQ